MRRFSQSVGWIRHALRRIGAYQEDFLNHLVNDDENLHDPLYATLLPVQRIMNAALPPAQVFFLGDSLTMGLAATAVTPKAVNWGIGGQTTAGLNLALPSYTALSTARAVFLEIGLNDLGRGLSLSGLEARWRSALSLLPPDVDLFWSELSPTAFPARSWRMTYRLEPSIIQSANEILRRIARDRRRTEVVPLFGALATTDGVLRHDYDRGDGIHLSSAGYAVWISALRAAAANKGLETS